MRQPVATNSMHLQSIYTPRLNHLSNQRSIWNPVKYLRWSIFAKKVFRSLAIFAEELHHRCLTGHLNLNGHLNATLSNKDFAESLRRGFPPLGLYNEILDSRYLLILLTCTKYKKMEYWTDPGLSFPWVTAGTKLWNSSCAENVFILYLVDQKR